MVLLILIYRSPIFFFIPLFAVIFAEIATRSIAYGLTEIGVTVNGQSSSILSILVLGAGTDYALLLVSRYREELRKHEDKHEAMALALRTGGAGHRRLRCHRDRRAPVPHPGRGGGHGRPRPDRGAGHLRRDGHHADPAARGAGHLRPGAFWRPAIFGRDNGVPHYGDEGADETHGTWRRVGERVARGPRRIWIGTAAVLLVAPSAS